jgi:hypothetical protein
LPVELMMLSRTISLSTPLGVKENPIGPFLR